ncbi:MAG: DUF551 domain-containing protein [Flavobacteriales bacterium]
MIQDWNSVEDSLPKHDQRVLGYIPGNKVFLPGKSLAFEVREVVVLRFCENFYLHNAEKASKYGVHFWAGEGNSNHYFSDVTHWMPVPTAPAK